MHDGELEGHWEVLPHQLADMFYLLLAILVLTYDLSDKYYTFEPLVLRYSLISSTVSSRLEQ